MDEIIKDVKDKEAEYSMKNNTNTMLYGWCNAICGEWGWSPECFI